MVKGVAAKFPRAAEQLSRLTLTRILSYSIRNLRAKTNPAREIQGAIMVPHAVHHKPIPSREILAFNEKVEGYSGRMHTVLAIKLLLLTIVRKLELIKATWDEIDLAAGIPRAMSYPSRFCAIKSGRIRRRNGRLRRSRSNPFQALNPTHIASFQMLHHRPHVS